MKDKSIKSTMKSWIMLSDKELDDTQVYMKEQEGENTESISEDREGIHHDKNVRGDSDIYRKPKSFPDTVFYDKCRFQRGRILPHGFRKIHIALIHTYLFDLL